MQVELIGKQEDGFQSIVVGVEMGRKLTPAAQKWDEATNGAISRAVSVGEFKGKKNEFLDLIAPVDGVDRILVIGLGDKLSKLNAEDLGGHLYARLNAAKVKQAALALDGDLMDAPTIISIAYGARLRSYRFDHYHTKEASKADYLKTLSIMVDDKAALEGDFANAMAVAEGVFMARDLISEPPNILYPESYCERIEGLSDLGLEIEILDEAAMEALGMHSLLGVGLGSEKESRIAIMRWNGGKEGEAPVAFVGKGVTFDTGGISLKPGPGMEEMKWDMGGSAVVVGLMKALAGRKANVNAVGLVGLVENMPDGKAQRPGDVVTSMSGQTIEIHNTDAEGRLVLADVLWYAQDRFKPTQMIDLATLTGAMIISLGHEYAGYFTNNDGISNGLMSASSACGEKTWRLPLDDNFDKMLKSDIADMKNIGGRPAGSITAAQFLQRFVNDTPWAHLDIAGVTWQKKDQPTAPKGATAFGVRLLDQYVREQFEG